MRITYLGGPSAIIEWHNARLLTDPTFDPAGEEYVLPAYTLRKTQGPALAPDAVGRIDAVLLSHDHHFDNLDRAGRAFLSGTTVLTTKAGAERLGGSAIGLEPWQTQSLEGQVKGALQITATPARHGPAQADRGPVIGFALHSADHPREAIYVSGDTVLFEGVEEVARRFDVKVAVLFLGAAKVRAVGDWPLTFTADEAVKVAALMPSATIVPVHFEGWEHFSESRDVIARHFREAGLEQRLRWPQAGRAEEISFSSSTPRREPS
jgi:L-ascorbate metabolism protein UlaG (beta-lactamase superfamily)